MKDDFLWYLNLMLFHAFQCMIIVAKIIHDSKMIIVSKLLNNAISQIIILGFSLFLAQWMRVQGGRKTHKAKF